MGNVEIPSFHDGASGTTPSDSKSLTGSKTQKTIQEKGTESSEVPKTLSPTPPKWSESERELAALCGLPVFTGLKIDPKILNRMESSNPPEDTQDECGDLHSLADAAAYTAIGVLHCLQPLDPNKSVSAVKVSESGEPESEVPESEVDLNDQTTAPGEREFSEEDLQKLDEQINWKGIEEDFRNTIADENSTLQDLQDSLKYIKGNDYKDAMKDALDVPEAVASRIQDRMAALLEKMIQDRKKEV